MTYLTRSLIALCLAGAASAAPAQDAAAVHQGLLTLDTHLDTPLVLRRDGWDIAERHDWSDDGSQVDLPRMAEGGLDGGFFVIFTFQRPMTADYFDQALQWARGQQQIILDTVAANPDRMELAYTAEDAARIADQGKVFVYQSIENSAPLGMDIGTLQGFYDNGVRMVGPVHSETNQFADAATGTEIWGGLSPLGRELVAETNRLGIVLDVSHASDAAFDEIIALSATPVIASHSGPDAIHDHDRNLDDARLRRLAETGGVISVNSIYLSERFRPEEGRPYENSTFEMFMASLLHLIEVAGVDHVAFGADWDGGGGVEGMRDITGLPLVTERLLAAGHSVEDLEKMWSGNVLRLLRSAEDHAASLASD